MQTRATSKQEPIDGRAKVGPSRAQVDCTGRWYPDPGLVDLRAAALLPIVNALERMPADAVARVELRALAGRPVCVMAISGLCRVGVRSQGQVHCFSAACRHNPTCETHCPGGRSEVPL